MLGNRDTRREQIWKDHVRKEEKARVKLYRDVITNREKGSGKMQRILISKPETQPKEPVIKSRLEDIKLPPASSPKIMRPVSEDIKSVLYQGVSKEEDGRYKYLLNRSKAKPEDKYYYPISSNSEYGWGLPQMTKDFVPKHARVNMTKTFYRTNNFIFPTPAGRNAPS